MDKNYDDANDLIKRLRNNKVTLGHGEYGIDPLCIKAADEIDNQQAEIEGLRIIIKGLERRLEHAEWLVNKYREEEDTK